MKLFCHDIDKNEFSFLYSGSRWSVVDSYRKFKVSFPGGKSSDYRQSNLNKIMRLSYTQVFAILGKAKIWHKSFYSITSFQEAIRDPHFHYACERRFLFDLRQYQDHLWREEDFHQAGGKRPRVFKFQYLQMEWLRSGSSETAEGGRLSEGANQEVAGVECEPCNRRGREVRGMKKTREPDESELWQDLERSLRWSRIFAWGATLTSVLGVILRVVMLFLAR